MAKLTLQVDNRQAESLPPNCLVCGQPTEQTYRRWFAWSPSWTILLIFFGIVPYLLVALLMTKRVKTFVALCHAHKSHWSWRTWLTWGSFALILFLIVAGLFAIAGDAHRRPGEGVDRFVCPAGFVLGMLWLITAIVVQTTSIRAVNITETSLTLTNVAKGYRDWLVQHKLDRARAREQAVKEAIASGGPDTKLCPFCGESIKLQAVKCRYCYERLPDEVN